MNFSVLSNYPIFSALNVAPFKFNISKPVRSVPDRLSVNKDLDRMLSKQIIEDAMVANPVIAKILAEKDIKPVVNIENFKKNVYRHSTDTRRKAMGIYNFLPADLKMEANAGYIQQGALLHDIGKVLIPENILNKRGKLNDNEAEIMHLHSKLSEEILSSQDIPNEVLNIVKYHHQNKQGTGYPAVKNTNKGFDINTEVVALADKFSALKETRSYKIGLTDEKALEILRRQVDKGEINARVYNALVGYVNSISPIKQPAMAS